MEKMDFARSEIHLGTGARWSAEPITPYVGLATSGREPKR